MPEPPHQIIVLEDADLLTLFRSECDADHAPSLVRVAPAAPIRKTESVTQMRAVDARLDQLFDRLQVLEERCRRIASSVDRQPAVSIQRGALQLRARIKTGLRDVGLLIRSFGVRDRALAAAEFARELGARHMDRITRHATVLTCLLLTVVLGAAPLLTRFHDVDMHSTAVSVRPAVRDARLVNIVLAADQRSMSEPPAKSILANGLTTQPAVANSTRTYKRAARYVGTLIVESRPAGAVVMVDQRKVGITPARIPGIPAGSHALWVVGDHQPRWTAAVMVRASTVTRVIAYLDRRTSASLDVRRSPARDPTDSAFSVRR